MKTLKILMLFALVALGTTVFASDDTKTTKENVKENPKEQCQDLATTQLVNVQVRFTDCPDYTCDVKNCTLYLCIYDDPYGNPIDCQIFDPAICTYDFYRISAEQYSNLLIKLVKTAGDCDFHDAFAVTSTIVPGTTDYVVYYHLCEP